MGEGCSLKDGVLMERVLSDIVNEYNILLDSYERMYESFKSIDYTKVDDYISTLENSRKYVGSISETQIRIENLREKIREVINNELIIDSLIEGVSSGRIGYINDRIQYIISCLESYEELGKDLLRKEFDRLQDDMKEFGL